MAVPVLALNNKELDHFTFPLNAVHITSRCIPPTLNLLWARVDIVEDPLTSPGQYK